MKNYLTDTNVFQIRKSLNNIKKINVYMCNSICVRLIKEKCNLIIMAEKLKKEGLNQMESKFFKGYIDYCLCISETFLFFLGINVTQKSFVY